MKTILYIRTSTDEQNPENQLNDCKSIYHNDYGDYEVIEDKTSAWKDSEREGFDKLKTLIMHNKINHLIVWDLDRLFRNRKKLLEFFQLCKIKKIYIHSYRQGWLEQLNDMPEPFNEMMHGFMLQMMGWIAQDESDKKSMRVRAAIRVKDGEKFSYKGNKWGRKQISNLKKNQIKNIINKNPEATIRDIAKEINVSIGFVHKYLQEIQ